MASAGCGGSLVDLRKTEWSDTTVPGSICGVAHQIKLHDGSAVVRSSRWPSAPRVRVSAAWSGSAIVYGDLTGDGNQEAAIQVDCANLGGTAAGQLAFGVVIYEPSSHGPRILGLITPRQPHTANVHVPLVEPIAIDHGRVKVGEAWYGPHDSDCCASGRAVSFWKYDGGSLSLERTVVEKSPT